jgi:hypothetical protein
VAIWTMKNMSIRVRRYVSPMAKWWSIFMHGVYALSTVSKKKNRGSTHWEATQEMRKARFHKYSVASRV